MHTGIFKRSAVFRALLTVFIAAPFSVNAQVPVPSKCFEIESILVDACVPGGGCTNSASPACNCEGKNEMVRFRTGPSPINTANISINWPNNSYLGIVQNALTASLTSQLNATIMSCGHLIEPPGGIIPAGKEVLLITSTDMCTTANSFANLADTMYVIFQNPGNYQGHFANTDNTASITSVPTGASSTRTMIMTYTATGCSDTATYDRSLLVNVFGTYGGSSAQNDGSTVLFSWPGAPVATYVNYGCQAPFVPLSATASGAGPVCSNGNITVSGTPGGNYSSLLWTGGTGTFTSPNSAASAYYPGAGDSGNVVLTFNVIGACQDTAVATVLINVIPVPSAQVTAGGPLTFCNGGNVTLTASGGTTYLWSTGSSSSSISVTAAGTYSVTATNSCGSDTASVNVAVLPLPNAQITAGGPVTFCAGDSVMLSASGGTSYLWSTGSTATSVYVSAAGTYTLTATNSCGNDTATVSVNVTPPPGAQITAGGPTTFCPGDSVLLTASGGSSFLWSTGATSASIEVNSAGTYSVTVGGTCGSDTASVTVNTSNNPAGTLSAGGPTTFCT
ncbi:MAG TPA: hypothetical protein VFU15_03675, partial [Bacteroidia bacterium]|nr:hypothetical protein [Bacteroidia bacterium]